MTASNSVIDRFYALRKAEFGYLERLELRQSVSPMEWSGYLLELELRSSATATRRRLRLEFVGVHDLRIGALEGLLFYMMEIRWIGDAQMERLNYRVVESEHDAFSFVCESFDASIE